MCPFLASWPEVADRRRMWLYGEKAAAIPVGNGGRDGIFGAVFAKAD
jgi:hypothetical protein